MEAEAAEEDRRAEVIKKLVVRSLGKMFGESSFLSFFSKLIICGNGYFVIIEAEEDGRAEGMKNQVVRVLDKLLGEYNFCLSFFSKLSFYKCRGRIPC